jgi:hypothetical protein
LQCPKKLKCGKLGHGHHHMKGKPCLAGLSFDRAFGKGTNEECIIYTEYSQWFKASYLSEKRTGRRIAYLHVCAKAGPVPSKEIDPLHWS